MEQSVEQFTYFIRQERERNYTVMDNTFLRDKRLSWKAKGLFAYILSLPSNWKIYQSELVEHATDGIASFRSAKKELITYGYIKQKRQSMNGVFSWVYIIIENPNQSDYEPLFELKNEEKTEPPKEEKKEKKVKKEPLINREPANDIEKVEKQYLLNYKEFFENGTVMTKEPVVNWIQARTLLKKHIETYGVETMLRAIENSKTNEFVIKNGYCLTMILSSGVLASLVNGNEYSNKKGFRTGQGVDRFNPQNDYDF